MNAILHCGRCGSWAEFFTDGDGNVIERLNHECTCPPRVGRPTPPPGRQPRPSRAKGKIPPGPHPCRSCPTLVHRHAVWCAECRKARNRVDCRERNQRKYAEKRVRYRMTTRTPEAP